MVSVNTRYVPSTADSSVSPHSSVSEVADIRNTTLSHTWTQGGGSLLVQGLERCYLAHVQHGLDAVKVRHHDGDPLFEPGHGEGDDVAISVDSLHVLQAGGQLGHQVLGTPNLRVTNIMGPDELT